MWSCITLIFFIDILFGSLSIELVIFKQSLVFTHCKYTENSRAKQIRWQRLPIPVRVINRTYHPYPPTKGYFKQAYLLPTQRHWTTFCKSYNNYINIIHFLYICTCNFCVESCFFINEMKFLTWREVQLVNHIISPHHSYCLKTVCHLM